MKGKIMFYNNPNLRYFKMCLENSSHKNGHYILQHDMCTCVTVYQNIISTWKKLPSFLSLCNHLKVFWYDNYENVKFNRGQKILFYYYVSSFTLKDIKCT